MSRSLTADAPVKTLRISFLIFPQSYLYRSLFHTRLTESSILESTVYWLIESNHRELTRHLRSTCCGLQISCLVSLSRLRDIQRSAGIALGRSRTRGLDTWMHMYGVVVRCLGVSWLADDADAWRFADNRLTSTGEVASWYPSWNLNINSVSNVERVWITSTSLAHTIIYWLESSNSPTILSTCLFRSALVTMNHSRWSLYKE